MSGVSCWKSITNYSQRLRRLMSWWLSGKSCHKYTVTRQWRYWRTSSSAWLLTWLWLPMVVTCSNSLHLQGCILISSPTNKSLFRATNRLPLKTTPGMLRNGGLSRLKQYNFVTFSYNSTKLSGEVYVILLNNKMCKISCINLHVLLNINKSHSGLLFLFNLYTFVMWHLAIFSWMFASFIKQADRM